MKIRIVDFLDVSTASRPISEIKAIVFVTHGKAAGAAAIVWRAVLFTSCRATLGGNYYD